MGRPSLPSYLALCHSGELDQRIENALAMLTHCELCPHRCGVDRTRGQMGMCHMGDEIRLSSWNLHPWEEPPISGTRGSGTIFFSGCTGRCLFCQNYPISQFGYGDTVTPEQLGSIMLSLQQKGAHNINLVTPTHFVPQILTALRYAIARGLILPLVYNSSGYERVDTLRLLDGIVDIWLPDAKYSDNSFAYQLSGFEEYVDHNRQALGEMFRQVGDRLILSADQIALRGMVIRHMVLPEGLAGTECVLTDLARRLSPKVHISLMDQYFPAYKALDHSQLGRKITWQEYEAALEALDAAGLGQGWFQSACKDD